VRDGKGKTAGPHLQICRFLSIKIGGFANMKKVIFGMGLFAISWAANAVQVNLYAYRTSDNGSTITTQITNGSSPIGVGATTATWDWDGTTISGSGNFTAVSHLGSSIYAASILGDSITDLSIDTSTSTASATSYACVEGSFLGGVGASGCAGTGFGTNFTNESTTVWGPGTAVSQTVGGDDTFAGGPRTISAYDYGLVSVTGTGMGGGDFITLGFGTQGTAPAARMTFQVVPVPAAVWLFGSALGLLGWARRKNS
jgi:hypothetical protein